MTADDPALSNRAVYELASIVDYYSARDDLMPGEVAVFRAIRAGTPDLKRQAILDIGCGGGRTSGYLIPLYGRYVGVDFAAAMVEACRRRFAERHPGAEFLQADARDLAAFPDAGFQTVLFSFNGLDTLNHDGRARALAEIRRVLKPGGWFAYSTHLLPNIEPRFAGTATDWKADARTRRRFAALNAQVAGAGALAGRDWALIRDTAHSFALLTHYIRPEAIAAELQAAGFAPPRLFAGYDDRELDPAAEDFSRHNWVYVLTRAV